MARGRLAAALLRHRLDDVRAQRDLDPRADAFGDPQPRDPPGHHVAMSDHADPQVDEGRLVPARRDLLQMLRENPPPPLMPGEQSPFDVLMELRADER